MEMINFLLEMKRLLLLTVCFLGMQVAAQQSGEVLVTKQLLQEAGLSASLGGSFGAGSLMYQHSWQLGAKQRWRLTYGARFSTYFGSDIDHVSAPPDFYGDAAAEDTVFVASPAMSNLTLFVGATYSIKNKVPIGFNIDAVGYTFGGDMEGTYTGAGVSTPVTVNPGSVTALLVGPNDIGFLKAEFFAGYHINEKWTVRLGITNMYTEVRTPTELQAGNTRYRAENMGAMLGVFYTFPNPLRSR